jgi:hypothetical protein
MLIIQPKRYIKPSKQLDIIQIKQTIRLLPRAATRSREIRIIAAVIRARWEPGGEGFVGEVRCGCSGGSGGVRRVAVGLLVVVVVVVVVGVGCRASVVLGVEGSVDFGGASEGREAVDGLGVVGVGVVGHGVEADVGELLTGGIGFGGFGEFLGGFVEVSAEVADGRCAGVGPDAAAEGDMFEDVDALVGESVQDS